MSVSGPNYLIRCCVFLSSSWGCYSIRPTMCYFLLLPVTFSAYAVFSTCLDFLELGISRSCRSIHTILPQTGRLCFPNLLFLSTIQCDKIHASPVQIHSKWSAESKNSSSSSTVPQFYNNSAQLYFLRLTYQYEFHCIQQTKHLGLVLHWLYYRHQELPDTYYRNYVTVKKRHGDNVQQYGFLHWDQHSAVQETSCIPNKRPDTNISQLDSLVL